MLNLHLYYVYILTNKNKTVLYVGVTNNLVVRIQQHVNGLTKGFTSKYNCHYLVCFEMYDHIVDAIAREKEIKGWRREKKENLVTAFNPEWKFLDPHTGKADDEII